MVEAGPDNDLPTVAVPALFLAHLAPDSTTNKFHVTKASAAVAGRALVLPSGRVLGGGSSTNMMAYSRASRSDWDSWEMPGWSAEEMLPFLNKVGSNV